MRNASAKPARQSASRADVGEIHVELDQGLRRVGADSSQHDLCAQHLGGVDGLRQVQRDAGCR